MPVSFEITEKEKEPVYEYDLVIIGGGPAGVRAAIEGGSRGLRVALVERDPAGFGVHGAPTGAHSKCLREAALSGAKEWADVELVVNRAITNAVSQSSRCLRTFHVEVLKGSGTVMGPRCVDFEPSGGSPKPARMLNTKSIVVATGSSSNRFPPCAACLSSDPPMPGVFDSDTIWGIDYIPRRMAIQGGGIVALEYAKIFSMLGAESVTILEKGSDVVRMLDENLREALKESLTRSGVFVITNTMVTAVEMVQAPGSPPFGESRGLLRVSIDTKFEETMEQRLLDCDTILAVPGRHGNSSGVGLESLEGITIGRGKFVVPVDVNTGYTGVADVYAVGDVAGCQLATYGQAQAVRAVRSCFGSELVKMEKVQRFKPSAVWTIPEFAFVGLTEVEAIKERPNSRIATCVADFGDTVRGCVHDDGGEFGDHGFLKLVFDCESAVILGVHVFGEGSSEIINYGGDLVNDEVTILDLLRRIFPAVTYHELYHLAATEAKLRLGGVKDLQAATAWKRMLTTLEGSGEDPFTAFAKYDTDGSGLLDKSELLQAMQSLGVDVDEDEVSKMMSEAGCAEGQDLDYRVFRKISTKNRKNRKTIMPGFKP